MESSPGNSGGCGIFGCADPANPIKLWEATFTIEDFTPRAIESSTLTSTGDYRVYPELGWPVSIAVTLTEGMTLVQVIPAPGTAGALALAGALTMRRRRAPMAPPGAASAGRNSAQAGRHRRSSAADFAVRGLAELAHATPPATTPLHATRSPRNLPPWQNYSKARR